MRRALPFLLVLLPLIARADDGLRLDRTRESLTSTWRHYTQIVDGLEVVDAGVIERVDRDGSVHEVHREMAAPPPRVPRRMIAASEATRSVPLGMVLDQKLVALNDEGIARSVWRLVVEATPHRPYAHYVDASTGTLLRSVPLFSRVQARVFDLNPVAKLNRPDLLDQNNTANAVPATAYSIVDLDNLAPSGPLAGPYAAIINVDDTATPGAVASQPLLFDRSQPQFEDVNVYFQLDRAQKYLLSLGYSGSRRLINYQLPADAHALNGDDNSVFLRSLVPGQGSLLFGDGGTDDAEDSDIVLHEFGHVIQDWIAPLTFTGLSATAPPAIGEGFADYWAFSSTYEASLAAGSDPFCIAEWDARCGGDDAGERCGYPVGATCLRRVDGTKTMANYDSGGSADEHKNGEIWSSALREIFMAMTSRLGAAAGKRMADATILEGTFGVPPNPTFATMAKKLIAADAALNGGANLQAICSAMTLRGILQPAECNLSPHGELTVIAPADAGGTIPDDTDAGLILRTVVADARSIDKLYVDVDIVHTSRGDLQLTLVAPDGTSVRLQQPTLDRAPDVRATFGLDAPSVESLDIFHGRPAAGEWKLIVQDLRPRDSGFVRSWSLRIQFTGDTPLTVRPFSFAPRPFIAAVAHATGANGTNFVSDVQIFNRSNRKVEATVVFTPSGQEGWGHFTAVKLQLAPRQGAVFNDVVAHTMQTSGTGNLDVVGDAADLIVTSRTYTSASTGASTGSTTGGTYGQSIPSAPSATALGAGESARVIAPLRNDADFRTNAGFSEVAGGSGVVRLTYYDAAGANVGQTEWNALPFEHVQTLVMAANAARAEVRVVSGDARVLAYGSTVDNHTGDAVFLEAVAAADGVYLLPVIRSPGVNGTAWRTDVALANPHDFEETVIYDLVPGLGNGGAVAVGPGQTLRMDDILRTRFGLTNGFAQVRLSGGVALASRTWTEAGTEAGGSYGVGIPAVREGAGVGAGDPPLDIAYLETSPSFRNNIGLMETRGVMMTARVITYDASGNELSRRDVTVGAFGIVQMPAVGARATVQVLEGGSGLIFAYGSIVDNLTGDPVYIAAQ
jgi:subtilisin-like proprotein convertase family protein